MTQLLLSPGVSVVRDPCAIRARNRGEERPLGVSSWH